MNDILAILDELQQEFAQGKNVFWSKKSLVNLDRCEELIIELKRNLPSCLQEAAYIVGQRDKILDRANKSAENTLKEAENRAINLVQESELITKAEAEAERILQDAQKKCDTMYKTTKNNIDKLLKAMENYFTDNLHVVRNNREELARTDLAAKPNSSADN